MTYKYKRVILNTILMGPQCEIIGKYVLPIFRSMLAKELVQTYHLSQTETAKKLGTTQAAISQYLSSKRAYKGMEHVEEFLPQIQTLATDIAKKIVNREIGAGDVTPHFCDLCTTFCKKTPATKAAKPENNS